MHSKWPFPKSSSQLATPSSSGSQRFIWSVVFILRCRVNGTSKLLRNLRSLDPGLHIKAFTAIEIRHLAERVFKISILDTFRLLREAGLNSLTGGGAEIFDPVVRDKICRGKETAEEWKDVHRLWHKMGGRSTCTMLFGHIETIEHRVDHLRQLRELQDETGGFTGFVPFAFVPETTELKHIKPASGSGSAPQPCCQQDLPGQFRSYHRLLGCDDPAVGSSLTELRCR